MEWRVVGRGAREDGQASLTVPHTWPPDAALSLFCLQTRAAQCGKKSIKDIRIKPTELVSPGIVTVLATLLEKRYFTCQKLGLFICKLWVTIISNHAAF